MNYPSGLHIALSAYFSIGFFGFYITGFLCRYGSINGFFGDLFVACCWGIFWPVMLVGIAMAQILMWAENKIGRAINIRNLILAPLCSYLAASGVVSIGESADISNSLLTLFFAYMAYKAFKNLHVREKVYIPEFVRKDLEQARLEEEKRRNTSK